MKQERDPLNRLLRAAARAPQHPDMEPPFGLESRVIAGWISAPLGDESAWLVPWLRSAMAMACVVVLLCVAWDYRQSSLPAGDEVSLADSTFQMDLNQ